MESIVVIFLESSLACISEEIYMAISSPIMHRARKPSDAFDEQIASALMHAAATGDVETVMSAVSEAGSLRLCPNAIEGTAM